MTSAGSLLERQRTESVPGKKDLMLSAFFLAVDLTIYTNVISLLRTFKAVSYACILYGRLHPDKAMKFDRKLFWKEASRGFLRTFQRKTLDKKV